MSNAQDSESTASEPRAADVGAKACDNCRNRKVTTAQHLPVFKGYLHVEPWGLPTCSDGRISNIDQRLDHMSQVLESLVADVTNKSQPSTVSSDKAHSPITGFPSGSSLEAALNDFRAHKGLPCRIRDHSTTPASSGYALGVGGAGSGRETDSSDSPLEGLSSLSAHSTQAIDIMHKVVDAECDGGDDTEIRELLHSLHQIVDAVKARRQPAESLFPLANPSSFRKQHTPADLPPIQVAVAVIRKAQESYNLGLNALNELLPHQKLSDICLAVYFSQDYSVADFIIVNTALYILLSDTSLTAKEDGQPDQSCRNYRLLCQRNLETALSSLPLHHEATHHMTLALVLGAFYGIDSSKPSMAWTLVCAAYQCSHSLGYHTRAYGSDPSGAPNQSGLLFWTIYYLEKHLCLRLGRCSAISDFEITVPLPGATEATRSPEMAYCRVTVKAGSLMSRVYEELYSTQAACSPREMRVQRVLDLSRELCAVREESRSVFQTWMQSRSDKGLPGVDMISCLAKTDEVFWWSLLTLIYRVVPASTNSSVNFADDCIASARAALQSHQAFASTEQLEELLPLSSYINWAIISSPFVPFLVLFCNAIEHDDISDLDTLQTFVDSLESSIHFSVPIAKHHKLFQAFHDVARRYFHIKRASTPSQQDHAELRTEMDNCLGALGLHSQDCMQEGIGDSLMFSPSMLPMQTLGNGADMERGLEQPVQMMNWYALSQQMIDSFGNDDHLSL